MSWLLTSFLTDPARRLGAEHGRIQPITLGGDKPAPYPTSYGVRGSAVSSPSRVRGEDPAAEKFSCMLEVPGGLPWNLLGNFGGWPMVPRSEINTGEMTTTPIDRRRLPAMHSRRHALSISTMPA